MYPSSLRSLMRFDRPSGLSSSGMPYGVRRNRKGSGLFAAFGAKTIVCSFTPSRMGIIAFVVRYKEGGGAAAEAAGGEEEAAGGGVCARGAGGAVGVGGAAEQATVR